MDFELQSDFEPKGDQIGAIERITEIIGPRRKEEVVLLGVTGSGKTFTMANVIHRCGLPALIIAPNKTLAAQIYSEMKSLFPRNAVEFFISYYDYYQPEAYIPETDTYIEKDSSINDAIDRMRHSATRALLDRRDVIIVASVSCIYGIGAPEEYGSLKLSIEKGERIKRSEIIRRLVGIQYQRNDLDLQRGRFRVRGDVIDIFPSDERETAIRIELFGDEVEDLSLIDPLTGVTMEKIESAKIYPATHYVYNTRNLKHALSSIREELAERLRFFKKEGKLIEAQRLEERTNYDLEMLEEIGYVHGIENYSRHLTGRAEGEPPPTLLDYFPRDFLIFIDESHLTIPQLRGMFRGDRSRKETLIRYGFRLPSALDNRPLNYHEFQDRTDRVIYVSATPGEYEIKRVKKGKVIEQVIRPTGLMDPKIEVRSRKGQVDDLLGEIRKRVNKGERVLVTTLTKRMAEELTDYYSEMNIRVKYLHSDIDAIQRTSIIRDLRLGKFDVLIGINLLREGLDIPEVSLVGILDGDREGFLRSARSLIQTAGRAARNVNGNVIIYADRLTNSIKTAINETERRRRIQNEYNIRNGITPEGIRKAIPEILTSIYEADYVTVPMEEELEVKVDSIEELRNLLIELRKEMKAKADALEFEEAAKIRDRIRRLEDMEIELKGSG